MIKNKRMRKRVITILACLTICINWNILNVNAEANNEDESEDPIIIVSLGDSYSSGEGIEPFYGQDEDTEDKVKNPDWLAHRSTKSWSSLLTIDGLDGTLADHKDENWFFVAASGAVTDNLLKTQKKEYDKDGYSGTEYLNPQLDIFDNLDENTVDYVTFTFGGNDVGFSDIITTAVKDTMLSVPYINPRKLSDNLNETWDEFYTNGGTEDNIKRAYESIADKAGSNAKIIVAGYPKLLEQNGKGILFTKDQAREINSNVTKFNQALATIVSSCYESGMKIYFVPVEDAFDGHEAYSADPYINKVIIGGQAEDLKDGLLQASAYSVHPNDKGAEAYASCVQAKIDELEANVENEDSAEDENSEQKGIQEKLEEEVEKQQERTKQEAEKQIDEAIEKFEEKLEEWLNQWLVDNCSC